MNWKFADNAFGWIIKIGTLIVNAPATFGLAYAAFATVGEGQALPEPLRILVAFSAVVLLEFILIKSWARLDAERAKSAPDPAEEFRHAFKAVAMYLALLAVAFLHGEGFAGIIFRLAFGIELGIAAWDSISREIQRASASTKAGARDWIVEGVQRRLMRRTAIYELRQFWGHEGVERYRRYQDAKVERERIAVDAAWALDELELPVKESAEEAAVPPVPLSSNGQKAQAPKGQLLLELDDLPF
jgi:hypothetical protein